MSEARAARHGDCNGMVLATRELAGFIARVYAASSASQQCRKSRRNNFAEWTAVSNRKYPSHFGYDSVENLPSVIITLVPIPYQ